MRGSPMLGSVPLMGSSVYINPPMARWLDSRPIHFIVALNRTINDRKNRARQGRAGQGSEIRGFLLVPSPSPTLSPIYDVLDVSVTSNSAWFHINHDMVSRRISKLSFYGEHSITPPYIFSLGV